MQSKLVFLVLFVFAVPMFLANKHWILILIFSLQLTIQAIPAADEIFWMDMVFFIL